MGQAIWRSCRSLFIVEELDTRPKSHEHRENNALEFVQSHLYHGIVDVVGSLLGFAVIINAL
jgi:metal iron transporter